MAVNTMLVVGSTVVGGLLVEVGQLFDAAGRLVAVRGFVSRVCLLASGPLAAMLAGIPFWVATAVGGVIALAIAPVAFIFLNEPATAKLKRSVVADAVAELRLLGKAHSLWGVAAFLFLVNFPRGFDTVLYYHQMAISMPVDVMGNLKALTAAAGLITTVGYGFLSPRLTLRGLVGLGIVCCTLGLLAHIFYDSIEAAIAISILRGVLFILGFLAFMELAVCATPRAAAAMGFAILMGVWNIGDSVGDYVAATLLQDWSFSFYGVAEIYSVVMALALLAVPLLPSREADG